jgi:two-component system sensor histidine kinase HydH
MSSPALTLLGVTLFLAGLIGLLIFVGVRLRTSARASRAASGRVSEEAFMATAIQEALAARAGAGSAADAAGPAQPRVGSGAVAAASFGSGSLGTGPVGAGPVVVGGASIDATILTSLPMGVMVVRPGSIVSRVNPAACRLLQLAPPPALPARLGALPLPPAFVELIGAASTRALPDPVRLELVQSDGQVRAVSVSTSPLAAEASGPPSLLVLLTDLTVQERRDALERRRASMIDAARLSSSLAHELANCLTGVHGYARMIDAGALDDGSRASLEALQKETDTLGETIEGFRRITRPLQLTRERFPMRWLVDDVLRQVGAERPMAAGAITAHVPEGLEVDGDRVLLEDALMHLVRNAVEGYTDSGRRPAIVVSTQASASGDTVTIVVEDDGPGLSPAERERLFEPFFSTKPGHIGLGLARARHIVHSHDGSIAAAHPASGGLAVTITLPMAIPASVSQPSR